MIRIAVVADSHFDEHSRFEECVRIHDWIANDIAEREVDLVLHSGDIYERKSTPVERHAVALWVQRICGQAPLVVARGNHDAIDDLPLLERLQTTYAVEVFEHAGVHCVSVADGDVAIAVMGWPQRGHLHAALGGAGLGNVAQEVVEQAAGDALRSVLRGLGDRLEAARPHGPRILLAHAMVRGSRVSTGQPLVGCDFELGLEDLALARANFYALGHVHLGQDWDIGGAPAVFPGSPRRCNYGETEPKGYLVVEFDGAELVGWERVETPCVPMLHLEADYYGRELGAFGEEWLEIHDLVMHPESKDVDVAGAECRLRWNVTSDQREAARAKALTWRDKLLAAGAVSCKLEECVQTEQRARAPEVASAKTLTEKLARYWTSTGFEPGDRREALLGKTQELESNNAN